MHYAVDTMQHITFRATIMLLFAFAAALSIPNSFWCHCDFIVILLDVQGYDTV